MTNNRYNKSNSFFRKTKVILALIGIIPYLMVVYLYFRGDIVVTDTFVLLAASALISILIGYTILRKSSDNLIQISDKTHKIISEGSMEYLRIKSDQELFDIVENFNMLIKKLKHSDDLAKKQSIEILNYAKDLSLSYQKSREQEEIRNRLKRYVGDHLVEKLMNSDRMLIKHQRKEITVMFADIRNFTKIAENMPAEKVVAILNLFFSEMTKIILKNSGILDKIVGDQIMATFGSFTTDKDAALNAVTTARQMQAAIKKIMKARESKNLTTFGIGIGINTGTAIIGNVGSDNRMDYTVIGATVNKAAKLQQKAKAGEIIIGINTYEKVKDKLYDNFSSQDNSHHINNQEYVKICPGST